MDGVHRALCIRLKYRSLFPALEGGMPVWAGWVLSGVGRSSAIGDDAPRGLFWAVVTTLKPPRPGGPKSVRRIAAGRSRQIGAVQRLAPAGSCQFFQTGRIRDPGIMGAEGQEKGTPRSGPWYDEPQCPEQSQQPPRAPFGSPVLLSLIPPCEVA